MTMNATFADFSAALAVPSARRTSPRIETFIRSETFERPTLVLDIDAVEAQYRALKAGLGRADIHYAVKANPAREIIERLVNLGSHFDAASRGEIELCLSLGARPETILRQHGETRLRHRLRPCRRHHALRRRRRGRA
jgi:ornithine decarboxylase